MNLVVDSDVRLEQIRQPIISIDAPIQESIETAVDIGHHNVSDLLESLSLEQRITYARKYDQRAPEQVSTHTGVIMTLSRPEPATLSHMRYRAELACQTLSVVTPDGALDLDGCPFDLGKLLIGRAVRVVPYFPSQSIDGLAQRCLDRYGFPYQMFGLPSPIAEFVKDKAKFHYFMHDNFPDLIPRFEVLTGTDLIGTGTDRSPIEVVMFQTGIMIDEVQHFGLDMAGYRNGVVLRKILSDGGFGTMIVRQKLDSSGYEVIGDQRDQDTSLRELMTRVLVPEAVYLMTRLLELNASPGLSCLVEDGQLYPLPLNGQIQDESGAAVGTKTLGLSAADAADIAFREAHEANIQALALPIFDKVLEMCQPTRAAINAMINLDFMVTSEREQALYTLVQQTPELHEHFWHLVSSRYQLAEMNPRMTNLSSAANGVLNILNVPHTIQNFKRLLAETGDLGLANYDSRQLHFPAGMRADDVYTHFLDRQARIRTQGYHEAGVILRMMPTLDDQDYPQWAKGAGITIYGPKRDFAAIEKLALDL